MTASGNDPKEEGTKSAILLHVAGPEALEVYNTFTWEAEADKEKVEKIMEKFQLYCTPRKNVARGSNAPPECHSNIKKKKDPLDHLYTNNTV